MGERDGETRNRKKERVIERERDRETDGETRNRKKEREREIERQTDK